MTDTDRCSIAECARPVKFRGLCRPHYRRWKAHGDATAGGASPAMRLAFVDRAVAHAGPECLIWPYGRNGRGYAEIKSKGRSTGVHRIVCNRVHGDPGPGMEAAHSCGRGHEGCVSGAHLSWKSRVENQLDRIDHGTWPVGEQSPRAKVNEDDVRAIRSAASTATQGELAQVYGVSRQQIGNIQSGKSWGHVR